jgi:hypothetical protein
MIEIDMSFDPHLALGQFRRRVDVISSPHCQDVAPLVVPCGVLCISRETNVRVRRINTSFEQTKTLRITCLRMTGDNEQQLDDNYVAFWGLAMKPFAMPPQHMSGKEGSPVESRLAETQYFAMSNRCTIFDI